MGNGTAQQTGKRRLLTALVLLGVVLALSLIVTAILRLAAIPPSLTWLEAMGYGCAVVSVIALVISTVAYSSLRRESSRAEYLAHATLIVLFPLLIGSPGLAFLLRRTEATETLMIVSFRDSNLVSGIASQQANVFVISPAVTVRFAESPEEFTLALPKPLSVGQTVDLVVYRHHGSIYKVRMGLRATLPN